MPNPTRDTRAGRVYNDLRNLARKEARSTDEVMVEYVLERFLYRLGQSPLGGRHFVLKGGMLLARFGARRMTRDIDILGCGLLGEEAEIVRRITAIAAVEVDDGVTFDPSTLRPCRFARRTSTTVPYSEFAGGQFPPAGGRSFAGLNPRSGPMADKDLPDRPRRGSVTGQTRRRRRITNGL